MRKATLASILRKSRPGVRLNEHLEHPGATCLPARLQDGAGGHCLEAAGLALPVWAISRLVKVQEPRRSRGKARGGGGLGSLIKLVAFKAPSHSRSGSRSPAFASSMIFWATASRVGATGPVRMLEAHQGHLESEAQETGGLGH